MTVVLALSGSTRAGSTNTALLRTAEVIAPAGLVVDRFDRLTRLPHFDPDDDRDPPHPEVAALRARAGAADAVLICTPEYASGMPGSFKNLLDWTVGGGELLDKPVAWVNASPHPDGARDTHDSLARVLGKLGAAVVARACRRIPVRRDLVSADGVIADPAVRADLLEVLQVLAVPQ